MQPAKASDSETQIAERFSAAVARGDVEAMRGVLKDSHEEAGLRSLFKKARAFVRECLQEEHGTSKALRFILVRTMYVEQCSAMASHIHKARIDALERRIAELESAQTKSLADSYEGSYLGGKSYSRGSLVTHCGSLWLCMTSTKAVPGDGSDWRLIVKRGTDAR